LRCIAEQSCRDVLSNEAVPASAAPGTGAAIEPTTALDFNLHSPSRQLIELRMAHADLNATIDRLGEVVPQDELLMRRLKKRRLALRDQIARVERSVEPQEPA
jgi:hypothetical protein